jgi:crossover junction endodeoxyribonuclease RuvC
VVGVGHAAKEQVQMMVMRLLPGITLAGPDAADALAVAICHLHRGTGTMARRMVEEKPSTQIRSWRDYRP